MPVFVKVVPLERVGVEVSLMIAFAIQIFKAVRTQFALLSF